MTSEPERIEMVAELRFIADDVGLRNAPTATAVIRAAADEIDRLKAELGSYGPPETEWRLAKDGWEDSVSYRTPHSITDWQRAGWAVSSRLVRRGPWVTNPEQQP